MVAVKLLLLLF